VFFRVTLQQVVVIPPVSDNYSLRNEPEERNSHLRHARSVKSHILERLQQNLILWNYFRHFYRNLILLTTGPKQALFNVKLTINQSPKTRTIQKSSVKHTMHTSKKTFI
jgi:hypothetical protein